MLPYIFVAGIPALLFYAFSLIGLSYAGFGIMEIIKDPAQQTGQSSFLGFLSNIGIWLWVSAGAISLFHALTYGLQTNAARKELLLLAGVLSMILAIDDFFMIHDRYVNQNICYLAYAVCAGLLLLRHFKQIIEIDGFSFLLFGSLLALSILTDLLDGYIPFRYKYVQIFEEGFKFVGAATWLYFSCRIVCFQSLPSAAKQ
ncbi:MAG: oxidase [Desulfobacteraceae bacterium]|nr:MAG: oxidase [Desulfobacteraceae bacterium]